MTPVGRCTCRASCATSPNAGGPWRQNREQRALAEALLEISLALNSTLETDPLFALILGQLRRVIPHDTSGIVLLPR